MLEERGLLDVEHLVLLYAVFEFADVRDERVVVAPWRQPRGKALERLIARAGDDVALRPCARDRAQRARADATDRRSQTLLRRLTAASVSRARMVTAEVPFIPSPLLHNVDGDPRSGPVVVGTVCWCGPTCLISRRVTMLFAAEAEPSDRRESGQTTTDRAIPHPARLRHRGDVDGLTSRLGRRRRPVPSAIFRWALEHDATARAARRKFDRRRRPGGRR